MSDVTTSAFEDTRWYCWADTKAKAVAKVTAYLKTLAVEGIPLTAVRTGLIRPQGYDYQRQQIRTGVRKKGADVTFEDVEQDGTDLLGREIGAGREASDKSLSRWRVDVKK